MILTRSYVHFRYRRVNPPELVAVAQLAFNKAQLSAAEYFPELSVSVEASAEQGSVRARTRLLVVAGALYVAIGRFGDFVSGVQQMARLARVAAQFINGEVVNEYADQKAVITERSDSALMGQLNRLFEQVQSGRLTATEAMRRAEELLRDHDDETMQTFSMAIRNALQDVGRRNDMRDATALKAPAPFKGQSAARVDNRTQVPEPRKPSKTGKVLRAEVWIDENGRRQWRLAGS